MLDENSLSPFPLEFRDSIPIDTLRSEIMNQRRSEIQCVPTLSSYSSGDYVSEDYCIIFWVRYDESTKAIPRDLIVGAKTRRSSYWSSERILKNSIKLSVAKEKPVSFSNDYFV